MLREPAPKMIKAEHESADEAFAAGAELSEIGSSCPVDYSLSIGGPSDIYIGARGFQLPGFEYSTVYIDTVGLFLTTRWISDIPSRTVTPHGAALPIRLLVGSEEWARDIAAQAREINHILVVPQVQRIKRLSDNLIEATYRREYLYRAIDLQWEKERSTWRRPAAEASSIGIRVDPALDVRVVDEAYLAMDLDRYMGVEVKYPSVGIALNHYNRPGMGFWAAWAAVSQIYPGDLMVTIVDDGSDQDNEQLFADSISGFGERCKYKPLRHNTGVASSWNIALRMLQDRDFVTYTSSDNLQMLGQILHMSRWAYLTGATGVSSQAIYIGEKGMIFTPPEATIESALRGVALGPSFIVSNRYMTSSGYMRKKYLYVEDTMCSIAMLVRGLKVKPYLRPLYFYSWGTSDSLTKRVLNTEGGWSGLLKRAFDDMQEESSSWPIQSKIDKELRGLCGCGRHRFGFSPEIEFAIAMRKSRPKGLIVSTKPIKVSGGFALVSRGTSPRLKTRKHLVVDSITDELVSRVYVEPCIQVLWPGESPLAGVDGLVYVKDGYTNDDWIERIEGKVPAGILSGIRIPS